MTHNKFLSEISEETDDENPQNTFLPREVRCL